MPLSSSQLLRRIRIALAIFITGLALSGLTAIPLETEMRFLLNLLHIDPAQPQSNPLFAWLATISRALADTNARYPFLAYGYDWLAFGHLIIALAFLGAWRDPVRNRWLFDFGLLACALVIPFALLMGPLRGIPFPWRLIDCSFGIFGAIPLLLARRWTHQLSQLTTDHRPLF